MRFRILSCTMYILLFGLPLLIGAKPESISQLASPFWEQKTTLDTKLKTLSQQPRHVQCFHQADQLIFPSNPNLKFSTKIKKSSVQTLQSPSGLKELQFITIKNPDYRLNNRQRKKILDISEIQMNTQETRTIIWKIENRELYRTDLTDYEEFESHCAYLIMRAEVNEKPENWRIHYWIGEKASIEDVVDIVYCAIQLDFDISSKMKICREAEGRESNIFKTFLRHGTNRKHSSSRKTSKKATMRGKRMFLVKGSDQIYLEEVVASVNRFEESDCVVFSSKKVHVFCKRVSSEQQKRVAMELAKYILDKRGLDEHGFLFYHESDKIFWNLPLDEREKFALFLDELERYSARNKNKLIVDNPYKFEPEEIRRILGQTVLDDDGNEFFKPEITKIYQDKFLNLRLTIESLTAENNLSLVTFNTTDCYIIDSQSNAGLFVWVGKDVILNVRKECAKLAECDIRDPKYFGKDGYLPNSIIYIHQYDVPLGIYDVQQLIRNFNPTVTYNSDISSYTTEKESKNIVDIFSSKAFDFEPEN